MAATAARHAAGLLAVALLLATPPTAAACRVIGVGGVTVAGEAPSGNLSFTAYKSAVSVAGLAFVLGLRLRNGVGPGPPQTSPPLGYAFCNSGAPPRLGPPGAERRPKRHRLHGALLPLAPLL
jgi:hypothetical protein